MKTSVRFLAWPLSAVLLVAGLAGCSTLAGGDSTGASIESTQRRIVPTVRYVPGADVGVLWEATRGFMEKLFPLDIDDATRRIIETQTLEWDEGGTRHRTRITVEIARDASGPANYKIGVVVLAIEPSWLLEDAATGQPLLPDWNLVGNVPGMEKWVADGVMKRYLLLRQGRVPSEIMEQPPLGPLRPVLCVGGPVCRGLHGGVIRAPAPGAGRRRRNRRIRGRVGAS